MRLLRFLQRKSDLAEEIDTHLNMAIADRIARGESPANARAEANSASVAPPMALDFRPRMRRLIVSTSGLLSPMVHRPDPQGQLEAHCDLLRQFRAVRPERDLVSAAAAEGEGDGGSPGAGTENKDAAHAVFFAPKRASVPLSRRWMLVLCL